MLLLDSRSLLVSATCPIAGQAPLIANLRGQFAEFPNVGCSRQTLAFSARAPVSVLGTDTILVFSRAPGWAEFPYPAVHSLRAITASTSLDGSTGQSPARPTPRRRLSLYGGTGMLTRFPFVLFELRQHLGPANPRLTNSAEEPLPLRPSRFSPDYRCYYGQDLRPYSVHTSSRPYFRPSRVPTYSIRVLPLWLGLGGRLEPRSFWAPRTSAGELLRFP